MERTLPQQPNYHHAILENIEDPISCELMTRAVMIVPCGHTFNENTVTQCLAHNKLCPLDRQLIQSYVPNYAVRHLAETVNSPHQEEEIYSAEAEAHFLKGKKASEEGDMEVAIEALLEALRLSPCYEKAQAYLEFCLKTTRPPSTTSASPEDTTSCGDKDAYIDHLLRLFDEPAIMSHPSLSQLLEKEVEQLMDQESVELSETALEKYKWTKKLLIDQKVSSFVAKKLQELSLSSPPASQAPFYQGSFPINPPSPHTPYSSPPPQHHSPHAPASYPSHQNSPSITTPPQPTPQPIFPSPQIYHTPQVITSTPTQLPPIAFGKAKWAKYFGDIGVEPPLPPNIQEILNAKCIFWPNKKVQDTHLLVLVPQAVNGKTFCLNSLAELIQSPKTGNKTEYRYYDDHVKKELGTKSVSSHWALMTRDVIPDSRSKTYEAQKALVASHAQKSKIAYELPKALDATAAILMHYVETGNRIYSDDPYTYTRCQEKVNKNQWPLAIGGFSSVGLDVDYADFDIVFYVGVGCVQKF